MDRLSPTSDRVAELVGGLTLACDVASGFPPGKVLRTVIIAMRLGRHAGASTEALRDAFFTSLFRFLGCTGFSHEEAARYGAGDDITLRNVMAMADVSYPMTMLSSVVRRIGSSAKTSERALAVGRLLGDGKAVLAHARAQCDTAIKLAALAGMSAGVQRALGAICERWDGRGAPAGMAGEAIDLSMRLHHVADGAEIALHREGPDAAVALVTARAGKWVDPALAKVFRKEARDILADLDGADLWERFLREEPEPHAVCSRERVTDVARAFAHLADLKSAFTVGHSTAVAALVTAAAEGMGLGASEKSDLERAALLHDLGRLSVPNAIWDRPGRLGFAEWERVRLHTYYTERVLGQSATWRALAPLSAGAHEQPSGKGYHRGLADASISRAGRLLSAADSIAAMREPRAYRPALAPTAVQAEVLSDVRSGRLDAESVDAILAGARSPTRRAPEAHRRLSDREVEVLRLVARGKTNKEIGAVLGISPRTVQVHVAHLYDKLGVYSRAGAALHAVEHGLMTDE